MPARPLLPTLPPPPLHQHRRRHHHHHIVPFIAAATAVTFFLLVCLLLWFRKLTRRRTVPSSSSPSQPPHRFPFSLLRRATSSFSPSLRLGQGGFGSVFRGSLPPSNLPVAVKLMDHGSLQGEREFHNELFFASRLHSPHILSVIGFSSDSKRHRVALVYELMPNGNLQDALLVKKCPQLMDWKKRFSIAVDISKGISYLHCLDAPVIHGDIKPSNILLDDFFSAKIGDFGLARLKSENIQCEILVVENENETLKINGGSQPKKEDMESNCEGATEDYGSVVEETDSVTTTTGFEDFHVHGLDRSPDSFVRAPISETSPEAVTASLETNGIGLSSEILEKASVDDGKRSVSRKDWWWKQDNGAAENGVVKDYVMEWIGTEIRKERPKSDWIGASSSSNGYSSKSEKKKKNRKRLDWWVTLDEEKNRKNAKKEKRRPREWWKEEYCEELAKKKRKKKKEIGVHSDDNAGEDWWPRDEETHGERKKKSRSRSRRSSRSSVDWWLDGLSGELWRGARRNSYDSVSGEILKSGGISSTPSMRGTMCYIAPEYGGGGDLSEKVDVYSYGVLLLVLIAGRRPLQVTGSPMSEFQRANLISWARHLARSGKLLELVDESIQSLDREQALLCITVALLCLQKSPARRPSMKEVVGMLTGESEPPQLPVEFSPSPPSRFPFKSRKKGR